MKIFILLTIIYLFLSAVPSLAADRFFPVESIDTMKYSRDGARDPEATKKIPIMVKAIAELHPTHIAIATPYDGEFYAVLATWVAEARKNNLKVWFRGNFASWEGWFDYPKLTNINLHHQMTYNFILKHPDLFEDGDIFTPVPEPENGGIGDPRGSAKKSSQFNSFLVASYANCVKAMKSIHKNVECGYFSTNGDVAKQVLTKDTVQKIGDRVVIDHYVKDPQRLINDIKFLHKKFDAPVVLGEFGAPIPDIHGDMTDQQQSDYIQQNLQNLVQVRDIVQGVNYWTAFLGSTAIFNDDFTLKMATVPITSYFYPYIFSGKITDVFGRPLSGFSVKSADFLETKSDKNGHYELLTTEDYQTITVHKEGFEDQIFTNAVTPIADRHIIQNFTFDYFNKNWLYYLRLFISQHISKKN